jgi:membrane dipeptidase
VDIAEHLWHMYQVGGEDVVAFGTDFDGFDEGELDISHMGEMHHVYHAIRKRGFTERQMDKILNGNILRVLQDV